MIKDFKYSDSLKCRMVGEILTDYFEKTQAERSPLITEALESIKNDRYYNTLVNAYDLKWGYRKNVAFSYCSEYAFRTNKRRLLLKVYDYIAARE